MSYTTRYVPPAISTSGFATSADMAALAPLASPALTGTPTAPTPGVDDSSARLATTAYVKAQGYGTGTGAVSTVAGRTGSIVLSAADIAGLGSAATRAAAEFATTAQGGKADTAVQPSALATYAPLASPTFTGTATAAALNLGTASGAGTGVSGIIGRAYPTDPASSVFTRCLLSSPNSGAGAGTSDSVYEMGWNLAGSGSLVDASKPMIRDAWENNYYDGSYYVMERHIGAMRPIVAGVAGGEIRPDGWAVRVDGSYLERTTKVTKWSVCDIAGAQKLVYQWPSVYMLASTKFIATVNNYSAFAQRSADGATDINLAYVDASNVVQLGDSSRGIQLNGTVQGAINLAYGGSIQFGGGNFINVSTGGDTTTISPPGSSYFIVPTSKYLQIADHSYNPCFRVDDGNTAPSTATVGYTGGKVAFYGGAGRTQPTGDIATGLAALGLMTSPTLDASTIGSGTVATARLGSGAASATTYLRGDSTWATVAGGSPGGSTAQLQYNNAGAFGGFGAWDGTTLTMPGSTLYTAAFAGTLNNDLNSDHCTVAATVDNGGYCSYDAQPVISGSSAYNHIAGFQFRPTYTGSGSIGELRGFWAAPAHQGTGTITNIKQIMVNDPGGSGPVTNNYGVFINTLTRGTNNYAIYSIATAAPSRLSAPLQIGFDANVSGGGVNDGHITLRSFSGGTNQWMAMGWNSTGVYGWIQSTNYGAAAYAPIKLNPNGGDVQLAASSSKIGFYGSAGAVKPTTVSATPVARTASAAYGATEQAMLQEAHDTIRTLVAALRTLGLIA